MAMMTEAEARAIARTRLLRGGRIARALEGSIPERHLSPALRAMPPDRLQVFPMEGARARIYTVLWRLLAEGRLRPGARISETAIETAFSVSRTMVMAALEALAREALIVPSHGRGFLVAQPSPQDAARLFDIQACAIAHVIAALAERPPVQPGTNLPSALPGTDERARIEQHFQAQEKAQAAGDLFAAQLLGAEFPVLLAAFHGDVMLTDLIARALAQQTLVLRLYGRFPPTPWDVDAQRDLALAIVARRGEDAIALFKARHAELFDKLWFGDTAPQGDEDLASLLAERTADPPGLPHKAHPHTTGIRTEP